VYVSDAPGKHDFALLRKLVFPSGKVLRASLPGRPTRDCVFADPCADGATALKIWNRNERDGCGVVGAFNVQGASWSRAKGIFVESVKGDAEDTVVAEIRPGDVETLRGLPLGSGRSGTGSGLSGTGTGPERGAENGRSENGGSFPVSFAVRAHRSGETRVLGLRDAWRVRLRRKQWEVYAVAETRRASFDVSRQTFVEWAFIGLTGMLNGGGAVLRDARVLERDAKKTKNVRAVVAAATVYGCGSLAAFASREPRRVEVDGEPVAFRFDRNATGAAGEIKGGRVLVPLGPREDTHEVRMASRRDEGGVRARRGRADGVFFLKVKKF
jgi:raffinose synthase